MRYVQQGTEFPGSIPSQPGIDKHKLFDNILLLMVVPCVFNTLFCCFHSVLCCEKPTSRVHLCFVQV